MLPIQPPTSAAGAGNAAAQKAASPRVAKATGEAPSAPRPEPPKVDAEQLKRIVEAANRVLKEASTNVEFSMDDSTGMTVIRLIDAGTKQVIRQFPSEEMLSVARAIDRMQGLLVEEKA